MKKLSTTSILKVAREKRGYTQKEVAEVLQVSCPCYCKIENGLQTTTYKNAYILSMIFNIDVKDIVIFFLNVEHGFSFQ